MARNYRSKILGAIHEAIEDAYDAGVADKKTMRAFDEACLTVVEPLSGAEIRKLREREGVSQAVFARHLNIEPKLIGEWERDEKRPSGPSLKLLSLVKSKGLDAIA